MNKIVECATHGSQLPAFVFRHLVLTLEDEIECGVVWSENEDGDLSANCGDCEQMLESGGGEWNDELESTAGISLICRECFNRVLKINGNESVN